jgi:alkylation response protein AidB-like acyl-CoA dehydrogenase
MTDTATALSPEEAQEFRERCIAFLDEHALPAGSGTGRGGDRGATAETGRKFLEAAADAGLAGIPYATEYGGAGLTLAHDKIWREAKANYAPMETEFVISHGMCLPMLAEYGTEQQKKEFMADNIAGRTMWCQMFSEPGAGSDVASLQTRAELDGDEWIINGQKVWTTLAHMSDYGLIIARTDPEQPKHAGISMFILDMKAPGVEIRPIHQIDGGSHFNEVFFTDVRIPKDWLLGDKNNGWRMATAMLMYERVAIGSGGTGKVSQPTYSMLRKVAANAGKLADPVVRDGLMQIYGMETTKALIALRTRDELKAGKTPGPGGSLGKLYGAVIARKMREIALEIAGPGSVAWEDPDGAELQRQVISSFSSNIAGGTDEIQRNIIGDRVLGLPREPAVDKGVPFKDLKVGTQKS